MAHFLTFVILDDNCDNGVTLISEWQESFPVDKDAFFWIQFDNRDFIEEDSTPEISVQVIGNQLKKGINCLATRRIDKVLETLSSLEGDLIVSYDLELGTQVWDKITKKLSDLIEDRSRTIVVVIHSAGQAKEEALSALDTTNKNVAAVTALTPLNLQDKKEAAKNIVNKGYQLWKSRQRPLERLWDISTEEKWFAKQSKYPNEPLMVIHSFDVIRNIDGACNSYRNDLYKAFGFHFPGKWFNDLDSVCIIHENLKRLCGVHYLGCNGHRNLTVGAAYLISLIAHFKVRDDIDALVKDVPPWNILPHSTSQFLSQGQTPDEARETALALYYMYERLFQKKSMENGQISMVTYCKFPETHCGKKFILGFNWNLEDKLSDKISTTFRTKSVLTGGSNVHFCLCPQEPSNTRNAFFRFAYFMYVNGAGFRNPGIVFIRNSELFVSSGNTKQFIILVACTGRQRRLAWAELLSAHFDKVLTCSGIDDWGFFDGDENRILLQSERPKAVDASIVHQGDIHDLEKCLTQIDATHRFYFDAPGNPKVLAPVHPIMRETSPKFDLSDQDAKEIADFVKGIRREVPSCCLPKKGMELLPALAILCQGYLAVHAEHKEPDKDWNDQHIAIALEQMDWNSVDKSLIPQGLGKKEKIKKVRNPGWWWAVFERDIENKKNLLSAIEKEWDTSSDKEISKELEDLIRLIVEENEVKPPEMVAKAYLALVENLGV